MLTGNINLDSIILNKLGDKDLVSICQTNKKFHNLCKKQTFWLNRIMVKFPYLDLNVLKQSKGNRDWRQYYINDLSKTIKSIYEHYLIYGSNIGRMDWVIIAIKNGANVKCRNDQNITYASKNGHLNVVKYLVENRADPQAQNNQSIVWASGKGHVDIVKYLVENRADPRARNNQSVIQALREGHSDIVNYLLSQEDSKHIVVDPNNI